MIILHSLVSLGYRNPRWVTTAQSSKTLMGCFHGRAFSSAQPDHPERGSKWLWCLPEPRAAAEHASALMEFFLPERENALGDGSALGLPRAGSCLGCLLSISLLCCSELCSAALQVLLAECAVWAGSGSRRAGLGTGGSGCPCSGTGHSAPSGCCHAVWHHLASSSTPPANQCPLGLGCVPCWLAGCFFLLEQMTLTIPLPLLKEIILFLFSQLPLPLPDRFK